MRTLALKTALIASLAALPLLSLTGCTYNYDDQNRRVMEEGTTYDVIYARIISATPVTIREEKYDSDTATAAGVVGGAVLGSVVGYNTNHHHYHGYHHGHHYHGTRGSSTGALVGGLVGAGLGLLVGEAVKSANNVRGLRLNLLTSNNENFSVDVPENREFHSGGYVQVNMTKSGYTQVVPISREGYDMGVKGGAATSLDTWAEEHETYLRENGVRPQPSSSDTIDYDDY